MSLSEFQEAFTRAMLKEEFEPAELMQIPFVDNNILGQLQMAAQRKRTENALYERLISVYETVTQVIGEDDMHELALEYFHKNPLKNWHPVDALDNFPYFLEGLNQSQALPFLADVATMDMGFHKAYHAINATTVRTSVFTELMPEELAQKRVQLHPACFWLSSPFAIHDIWRMHHSPIPPKNIDFHVPQDVIIVRPHITVEVHKIDTGFTNALDRLDSGETMDTAFSRASRLDKNFNAVAALQFLIQNNLIVTLF